MTAASSVAILVDTSCDDAAEIRKGFIPDDILNKEHDPKDFIEVNIHTDIRKVRENLKQKKKGRK